MLSGSRGKTTKLSRAGRMPSSQPSPARRRLRSTVIGGLLSAGAAVVGVVDAGPLPVLIHGAERRSRRRLLDGSERQQKRENKKKFSHSVHSFRHLWHARVMPEDGEKIIKMLPRPAWGSVFRAVY